MTVIPDPSELARRSQEQEAALNRRSKIRGKVAYIGAALLLWIMLVMNPATSRSHNLPFIVFGLGLVTAYAYHLVFDEETQTRKQLRHSTLIGATMLFTTLLFPRILAYQDRDYALVAIAFLAIAIGAFLFERKKKRVSKFPRLKILNKEFQPSGPNVRIDYKDESGEPTSMYLLNRHRADAYIEKLVERGLLTSQEVQSLRPALVKLRMLEQLSRSQIAISSHTPLEGVTSAGSWA